MSANNSRPMGPMQIPASDRVCRVAEHLWRLAKTFAKPWKMLLLLLLKAQQVAMHGSTRVTRL